MNMIEAAASTVAPYRASTVLIIYITIFTAVYLSVLVTSYGFLDDYTELAQAMRHQMSYVYWMLSAGGRPIFTLLTRLSLPAMTSLDDLRYLRAVAVSAITLVAMACHVWLSRVEAPFAVRLGLPVALGLTPAFQVFAAWATAGFLPLAAALGGSAFAVLEWSPARRRLRIVGSVALLAAALAIYQPAAMFFWVFAGIKWIGGGSSLKWRAGIAAVGTMAAALAIDFALAKILPRLLWPSYPPLARTKLTQDIPAKLIWFVSEPLPNALNLAFIQPKAWIAICVAVFVAGGLWLYWSEPTKARLLRLIVATALLPAAYLPNLLVSESWASYRSQIALTALLLVYATFALVGWLRVLRRERWLPAAMAVLVAFFAVAASRNVILWFVLPQSVEYALLERALDDPNLSDAKELDFYKSSHWSLTRLARYDEFDLLSSAAAWPPPDMAWLILHARHSPLADLPMRLLPRGATPSTSGSHIIDMDDVLFGQGPKS